MSWRSSAQRLRSSASLAILVLTLGPLRAEAAEATAQWVIAIVGRDELRVDVIGVTPDGCPVVDARRMAPALGLTIREQDDGAVLIDALGHTWPGAAGIDAGGQNSGTVVRASAVYAPLNALVRFSGGDVVIGPNQHAFVFPHVARGQAAPSSAASAVPVTSFTVEKTAAEIEAMRRLEGLDLPGQPERRRIEQRLVGPQHEALRVEVGAGLVAGYDAATDLSVSGTMAGFRTDVQTFLALGRDGVNYRTIRGRLEAPDQRWLIEAGDLASEIRGLSRGARLGWRVGERWQPGLALYLRSNEIVHEPTAVAVRNGVTISPAITVYGEVASDRSGFARTQHAIGRATVESFYRRRAAEAHDEYGGFLSVDLGRGFSASAGAREAETSSGGERWHSIGLRIPISRVASVSLDRARLATSTSDRVANGLSFLLPLGPLRIMQRFQWSDPAIVKPIATEQRQVQSMVFYSPVRGLQLSYQSVTQWYEGGEAGIWNQVEADATLRRGTTFRVAAKVPELNDTRFLSMRLTQALPRKFSASIEWGAVAAFHPRTLTEPTGSRLLLMVRRTLDVKTPAAGGRVTGLVRDDVGRPVPNVVVRLGDYQTPSDDDGRYDFGIVPAGTFTLEVDAARLDANYVTSSPASSLTVARGSRSDVDLRVTRLASIGGLVYLDRNLNQRADPGEGLAGVVVLMDGRATTTDQLGRYRFFNLPDGEYRVILDTGRLRRDVEAAPPTEARVVLESGRAGMAADFRVVPRGKPTVMQEPGQ